MLQTEPMQKVRAIFLAEDKKKVIDSLHEIGIIDFRKSKLQLVDDTPLPYYSEIYELLVKFEGALRLLPKQKPRQKFEKLELEELLNQARNLKEVDEIYELAEKKKVLEQEYKALSYAYYVAKGFSCLKVNLSKIAEEAQMGIEAYAFKAKSEALIKLKNKSGIAVNACNSGEEIFALVAYEKNREKEVHEILDSEKQQAKRLDIKAKYLEANTSSDKLAESLAQKLESSKKKAGETEKRLSEIGSKTYAKIAAYVEMLHIELDRAKASSMFKKTEATSILEGWLPAKRTGEFEKAIEKATKGRCSIELLPADELAPTLLGRKGVLSSFDYAVEFFSVPRSDELDPTWAFIFSFLIFYGFMVSDVGYGILSFLLATWICKITNPDGIAYNAARIWQIGAIPAIVFGVLTNQYFGIGLNKYFLPFTGIEWTKNITGFLAASVLLGMAEILIGLAFGFVNKYRHGEKAMAYGKLSGMLLLVTGSLFVYGALFRALPVIDTEISGILAAVFLVGAIVLGGREGAETMSLITHTLSYSRLVGFGITSVMIAYMIDMAFTPTLSHGMVVFVLLVIAFLSLHTLNMIVSIFEGIVQGIRLNVVEFFTKFYTGGGIKFKPFEYKKMLTK
ncbi:MAG: V-type ATP synthase subunit I [Candidatus Micrarchaeia archaeon]